MMSDINKVLFLLQDPKTGDPELCDEINQALGIELSFSEGATNVSFLFDVDSVVGQHIMRAPGSLIR